MLINLTSLCLLRLKKQKLLKTQLPQLSNFQMRRKEKEREITNNDQSMIGLQNSTKIYKNVKVRKNI